VARKVTMSTLALREARPAAKSETP
jgi:hypothetical protein